MRESSSKCTEPKIAVEKALLDVSRKMDAGKPKKEGKGVYREALETVKAMGLLLSYEIKIGATGEPIMEIALNKDCE
jgi:hypothetical protein